MRGDKFNCVECNQPCIVKSGNGVHKYCSKTCPMCEKHICRHNKPTMVEHQEKLIAEARADESRKCLSQAAMAHEYEIREARASVDVPAEAAKYIRQNVVPEPLRGAITEMLSKDTPNIMHLCAEEAGWTAREAEIRAPEYLEAVRKREERIAKKREYDKIHNKEEKR